MFKQFLITFLFLSLTSIAHAADTKEIWITPDTSNYSRLATGLAGSNITIISSDEIAKSTGKDITEILKSYSGIQVRSLYSGIDGINSTIDMRGFGEAAKSNFLMLLNGRRLNDLDMGSVNFSNTPLSSIDRIEIVRGNSAGTIYGSGAVGGAINIVTKDSSEVSDIINLSYGSFDSINVDFTASINLDKNTSMMVTGKTKETDTYRESGDYDRDDILFRLNHKNTNLKSYLDISSSSKNQLLSGPRVIGGAYNYHLCNLLSSSRTANHIGGSYDRNANTCNATQRDDYANEDNISIAGGLNIAQTKTRSILIDVSTKSKDQKAFYAANGNNSSSNPNSGDSYIETTLDNSQFSLALDESLFIDNNPVIIKFGGDLSDTDYDSDRYNVEGGAVGQVFDASQESQALFFQASLNLLEQDAVMSLGIRKENTDFYGADTLDTNVTGFGYGTDHETLSTSTSNTAFNIGFEKILDSNTKIFTKYAESFRTPNIDERIKATTTGSFALNDQTSDEIEIGLRYEDALFYFSGSIYSMDTESEIQFDQDKNTNLDPISREGVNIDFNYRASDMVRLSGSYNYVDAEFTSGSLSMGTGTYLYDGVRYYNGAETYGYLSTTAINYLGSDSTANQSFDLTGNKVPLVAPVNYKFGAEIDLDARITALIDLQYVDERYVSNDQENIETKIPDYYVVNTKVISSNGPLSFSAGISNIFNEKYYDFAVSSTFHDDNHFGTQGVYPLAERNAFISLGYTF
ncbi:MAG: TonB-dependent receptor [Candidatus Pelagibacterales bacterium]